MLIVVALVIHPKASLSLSLWAPQLWLVTGVQTLCRHNPYYRDTLLVCYCLLLQLYVVEVVVRIRKKNEALEFPSFEIGEIKNYRPLSKVWAKVWVAFPENCESVTCATLLFETCLQGQWSEIKKFQWSSKVFSTRHQHKDSPLSIFHSSDIPQPVW